MKSFIFFLTQGIQKYTIFMIALFFILKLSFIVGQEVGDYDEIITENGKGNLIYLDKIPKEDVVYFRELTTSFIDNMKKSHSNVEVVEKFQEKLNNLTNEKNSKNRHKVLLLMTSSLIEIKNYAINFNIPDKDHMLLKKLLPSLNKLSTEYPSEIFKRSGEMYIPNFLEALSFLQPEYGINQIMLEKENNKF